MASRVWAWLRKPRVSWVDIGCTALIWVTATVVQYFTGWQEDLAFFATAAGAVVFFSLVAFFHGVWEAIRHG